ncbi:MAG TPA: YfiR family protein [Burkholderiaceae bacterium]|nr:YfiR family protein [Burkholderiaceae bacterium]
MRAARLLLGLLISLLGVRTPAWAAPAADTGNAAMANKIKATYVYKFAGYVDWPGADTQAAAGPFTIGVVDAEGVTAELKALSAAYPLKNRPVQIRELAPGAAVSGVQMVFIGQHAGSGARQMLSGLAGKPVLTITEADGMLSAGSTINLLTVDERIRFEVSLAHAAAAGLKVSARLLDVAYKIEGKEP